MNGFLNYEVARFVHIDANSQRINFENIAWVWSEVCMAIGYSDP